MTNFVSTFHQLGVTAALDMGGFALDQEHCGVLITSAASDDCRILYANANFIVMTGFAEHEIIGHNCRFLQKDDRDHAALAEVRRAIRDEIPVCVELRNYRKDGSMFWCGLSITPFRNALGEVTHFIGTQTNLDAQKEVQRMQQRMQQSMQRGMQQPHINYDADNHAEFTLPTETGQREWFTDIVQSETPCFLVLIDIDQASSASTSTLFGSRERELIQRAIAQRLRDCIGESHRIAQFSTGRFAALLRTTRQQDVSHLCEKIQQAVQNAFSIVNQTFHATCSIGIAQYPNDATTIDGLLNCARLALRQTQVESHNHVLFYSSDMQLQEQHRQALEAALRSAISNNELQMVYQPQVNLTTGTITCIEALARWFHPQLGEIAPACFIALAEEIDLIDSIGTWIFERVCRDLIDRRQQHLPSLPVAVNISPLQLRSPTLIETVAALISTAAIESSALILEITEAVLMDDDAVSQRTLLTLQEMGIALTLDDFGTRYSSLNHLKHLRFSNVKIDGSFISNVVDNPADAAMVKTIISMAHTLGLKVIAEGVETDAQCAFLRDNMCDEIQGFLFSQPLATGALNALLREGATLPTRLREPIKPRRTLLLVDDEVNIVAALKRLLRRDDYLILTAHSGIEGLEVLKTNPVDVILSDQRMPGMTGVEFLSIAKKDYPETIRLVLSGYTELQSVTDAVNEGAIYKFLTKPWDDAKLRGHIREAFERKELVDVNFQLARDVYVANLKLATANRQLEELVGEKQQQITRDANSLQVVRDALQQVPLPVIAVDDTGMIAFVNDAAAQLLHRRGCLLAGDARDVLPEIITLLPLPINASALPHISIDGKLFQPRTSAMGTQSQSRGYLITLAPVTGTIPSSSVESAT